MRRIRRRHLNKGSELPSSTEMADAPAVPPTNVDVSDDGDKKKKRKHDGETAEEKAERKKAKKEKKEKKEKRKSAAKEESDSEQESPYEHRSKRIKKTQAKRTKPAGVPDAKPKTTSGKPGKKSREGQRPSRHFLPTPSSAP